MEVVVDSHALLWFVSNNKKLSEKAKRALNKSSKIIISTIVLLELLYILQKYGQENKFNKLLDNLTGEKYLIYWGRKTNMEHAVCFVEYENLYIPQI